MANPAARRILGLGEQALAEPIAWQPPAPLREPLATVLQTEHAFLPEGFDQAVPVEVADGHGIFCRAFCRYRTPTAERSAPPCCWPTSRDFNCSTR